MSAQVTVTSFGYGHAPAPDADLTVDARRNLRNPHHDSAMRELTGLDAVVYEHVLDTPGATSVVHHAVACALELAEATGRPVTVATGCVGGRHRSVALARAIGGELAACGLRVTVEHRDIQRPVIQK